MARLGDYLWTVSSSDHTLRLWNTNVSPTRSTAQVPPPPPLPAFGTSTNSGVQISYRKIGSVFENFEGQTLSVVSDAIWIGGTDGTIRIWDPVVRLGEK